MILIMVMQEFDKKLTEVTDLIRNMGVDTYHFERDAIRLALDVEEMAEQYGMHIQPDLALIRGNLMCGYHEEKGCVLSRKERGKERQRYIVNELAKLVGLVQEYFKEAREQFQKCERICGQIIVNAYYRGLHQKNQDLYVAASQDAELAPHVAEINGAVGCVNAKVIFEQAKAYIKR